jgi:hypothetical protein
MTAVSLHSEAERQCCLIEGARVGCNRDLLCNNNKIEQSSFGLLVGERIK